MEVRATLSGWYQRFTTWCGRHLFFVLAGLLGIWALGFVPQVKNLWHQLPPKELPLLWVGNIALLAVLGWLYVPSWFVVASELATPGRVTTDRGVPTRLAIAALLSPAEIAATWLPSAMLRLPRPLRFLVMFACSTSAGMIWAYGSLGHESRYYPLAGSLCSYAGLLLLLVGIWLLWASVIRLPGPAWVITGRALSWLIVGSALGETVWIFAHFGWLDATYRVYSVWSLFHLFSVCVIAGALIDYCTEHTTWPVRPLVVIGLIAMIGSQRPEALNELPSASHSLEQSPASRSSTGTSERPDWYTYALERLEQMPPGPVVIVAASGGGSRAAIFTALVLEKLAREPMAYMLPTESWVSDPEVIPSASEASTWADHILIISSVSGGSLATADFAVRGWQRESRDERRNIPREELLILMENHLHGLLRQDDDETPLPENLRSSIDTAIAEVESIGKNEHAANDWILSSPYVDDMATDFMAPILRGLYTPGLSRGDSLAHFWNERLHWKEIELATWNKGNARFSPPHQPLIILNACDIDRAARLAIGFPALPPTLLRPADDPRRPFANGEPVALSDLEGPEDCNLTLARAVRLSSNFPWGFPISQIDEHSSPKLKYSVRVLDGGVIDNTGIDTIHYLARGLLQRADANPNGAPARIVKELRRRGVVLIEIDSGARPVDKHNLDFFSGLTKPLQALNNALYSNAEQTKHFYVDQIRRLTVQLEQGGQASDTTNDTASEDQKKMSVFLSGLQNKLPTVVFHHRFRCNHIEDRRADVMTAWALGPEDEAIVLGQFLTTLHDWQQFRDELPGHFRDLHDAVDGANQSVRLIRFEYQMLALLESVRENDSLLRELVEMKRRNAPYASLLDKRDEVLDNFRTQQAKLDEIASLIPGLAREADYRDAMADLQLELQADIAQLADAKDISIAAVERMLDSPASTSGTKNSASLVRQTSGMVSKESRQSIVQAASVKQSTAQFQQDVQQRSRETERYYDQLQKKPSPSRRTKR